MDIFYVGKFTNWINSGILYYSLGKNFHNYTTNATQNTLLLQYFWLNYHETFCNDVRRQTQTNIPRKNL